MDDNRTSQKPVRTRIAPSPTGDPHIGTAYMALFNYVFAKRHGGQFIIRIEDTDQKRYRASSEAQILQAVKWVGIDWDEGPDIGGPYGPYKQSLRLPIYHQHVNTLLEKGHAYRCFCTTERLEALRKGQMAQKIPPGYDRLCRDLPPEDVQQCLAASTPFVVRMKAPTTGKTIVHDLLRGYIEFENAGIDDQVLLKTDGFPTYHLAVVVDDELMQISHIIRGEEWIASAPKHVLLYDMFGFEKPVFCHMPLLRNSDKSKISKRKNPTSILYYKRKGILPEALRNFLALMGWRLSDTAEIFSTDDMIRAFDLQDIHLGGPVFDMEKLSWLNGQYLKSKTDDQWIQTLFSTLFDPHYLKKIIPLVKERVEKLEDFIDQTAFFFSGDLHYTPDSFAVKGLTPLVIAQTLEDVAQVFDLCEDWVHGVLHDQVKAYMDAKGLKMKTVFLPIRIAVTGTQASPPLFECLQVLGKDIVQRRMRMAIQFLRTQKEV